MRKLTLIIALGTLLVSCATDEKGARRALENEGLHPIHVGGYGWNDCSEDDHYKTRFKAYSADSSRIVEGCVCAGWFKGSTVRFD